MFNKIEEAVKSLRNNRSDDKLQDLEDIIISSQLLLTIQKVSEEEMHLVVITNKQNERYLPVYSDLKNMELNQQELQYTEVTFEQLVELLKQDSNIDGIVIDPYSNNIPFTRDDCFSMQARRPIIKKGTKISIGEPSADVSGLVAGLTELMGKYPTISTAYLVQSVNGETKQASLLVVVNNDDIDVMRSISAESGKLLAPQEILDFVPESSGIGKFVADNFDPFYNRS